MDISGSTYPSAMRSGYGLPYVLFTLSFLLIESNHVRSLNVQWKDFFLDLIDLLRGDVDQPVVVLVVVGFVQDDITSYSRSFSQCFAWIWVSTIMFYVWWNWQWTPWKGGLTYGMCKQTSDVQKARNVLNFAKLRNLVSQIFDNFQSYLDGN